MGPPREEFSLPHVLGAALGLGVLACVLVGLLLWPDTIKPNLYYRLSRAVRDGDLQTTRLLLKLGLDQNRMAYPPLLSAARTGNVELGRLLLERGADVNGKGKTGELPLETAARHGHVEVLRLLLDAGADVDRVGPDGTALMAAVRSCHVEAARVLLDAGASSHGSDLAWVSKCEGVLPLLPAEPPTPVP